MKTLVLLLVSLLCGSTVFASTIHLTNGKTIENAKILEQTDKNVKIDLNGMTMTYYLEEIKDIDGRVLSQPVAVKTPVPVPAAGPSVSIKANLPVSDNSTDKRALILKFIEVFGTRQAMNSNFNTMVDALAQQKPEEAKRIRENFKIDEVIERLIPSYDKHFTTEDLQTYIEFYSSEKGRKLTSSIGAVMQDSIEVGTAYLKEKFPELEKEQ